MIEASQRMIRVNSQGELGGINPVIKNILSCRLRLFKMHLEMQMTSWNGF
jgi:hypothetical protein